MKRFVMLGLLVLASCAPAPTEQPAPTNTLPQYNDGAPMVWVDPDTGCQYLVDRNGGLTPRTREQGNRLAVVGCRTTS